MKIKNTDTGEITEITHAEYEHEVMTDVIGNCGFPEMGYDEEDEVRTANTETIEWWQNYADRDAEMLERKNEIAKAIKDDRERERFEEGFSRSLGDAGEMEVEYACGMDFLNTYAN